MRHTLTLAYFALLASASAAADPYQLVGFSSATFKGGSGVRVFTEACQADFGPAARMCKSTEVLETVVWPQTLSGFAWVMPVLVPGINGTDASGSFHSAPSALSCEGWSNDESDGLVVFATGAIQSHAICNISRSVACCRPVPLPEPSASVMEGVGAAALGMLAKGRK